MPRLPSARAHEDVLKAALELMAEHGIDRTSVDAIAHTSSVSKATIYKHWKDKDALCLEAIGRLCGDLPVFDSGDPRADIAALLRHLGQSRKREDLARIWPRMIGYAVNNPAFGHALHDRIEAPRRKEVTRILRQAIAHGQLRARIDFDLAMDLLIGPIIHRRFMNEAPIPSSLPGRIVDAFWKAHAPTRRSRNIGSR